MEVRQMKKWVGLILIVTLVLSQMTIGFGLDTVKRPDIPVVELRASTVDSANATEVNAYFKGVELLVNSYFMDVHNTTYEEAITRMSALGVVKKYGSFDFEPERNISRQEMIEFLVRMNGNDAAVQQRAINNAGGMSSAAFQDFLAKEYVTEAINQGIVLAVEDGNLGLDAKREETAVWISRMLNLQPTFNDLNTVYGFEDWASVTPANRGIIETIVTEKIMTPGTDGNFKPDASITRGDVAGLLKDLSPRVFGNLNVTSNFGFVVGKLEDSKQEAGYTVDETKFVIRNIDGSVTTIKVDKNNQTKAEHQFVSYKDGVVSNSRVLEIGDQIEYLQQNGEVVYVQVHTDGSVIEKLRETTQVEGKYSVYYAEVHDTITEERLENNRYIVTDRMRVKAINGIVFDIVVDTFVDTGIKNDIIVYKDEKVGGMDLLQKGDDVQIVVSPDGNISYVSIFDPEKKEVYGTVRFVGRDENIGEDTITIFGYDDVIREFIVARYAGITVNSEYANLSDLKYGMDVKITVNNGYATLIVSETFTDNPGYIPEFGKMRIGEIHYIYNNGISVKLNDGSRKQYLLPEDTPVNKEGRDISIRALKEGDKVKLFFNDIYTNTLSRVEVEGVEQLIEKVYKGVLNEVVEGTGEIIITEPEILKNTKWEKAPNYNFSFEVDPSADIYSNGKRVRFKNLSREHKGDTIYVVVKDAYGKPNAVKLAVANGGERIYFDDVYSLDRTRAEIELGNRNNLVYSDGTIFIKDNRLVTSSALRDTDDALFVSDFYRGNDNLNVVSIVSGAEDIFNKIYIGAIEKVSSNYITMIDHSKINGNSWGSFKQDESKKYYYNTGTDIQIGKPKSVYEQITYSKLFHGAYSRLENKSKDNVGLPYERYYTIFVTDKWDTSVLAMRMRYNGVLEGQNIDDTTSKQEDVKTKLDKMAENFTLSRGILDSVDTKWKRLGVTDTFDWKDKLAEWEAHTTNTSVDYNDAIIVKDNKVISVADLRLGDNLYYLRDDENGLVIIVNN